MSGHCYSGVDRRVGLIVVEFDAVLVGEGVCGLVFAEEGVCEQLLLSERGNAFPLYGDHFVFALLCN